LILIALAPLVLMNFLKRNYLRMLIDEEFNKMWGSIYQNLRITGGLKPIMSYIGVYFLRRFIYAFILVFLVEFPAFQVIIFTLLSTIMMVIHFLNYPLFDDRLSQMLEIYNEVTIFAVGILLYPLASEEL
jgi:uncharacterized protein involved in cysteine biosynthesis